MAPTASILKEEIIYMHLTLFKYARMLEIASIQSNFDEYKELGILPSQVYKSKQEHRKAVLALIKGILDVFGIVPLPTENRIKEYLEKTLVMNIELSQLQEEILKEVYKEGGKCDTSKINHKIARKFDIKGNETLKDCLISFRASFIRALVGLEDKGLLVRRSKEGTTYLLLTEEGKEVAKKLLIITGWHKRPRKFVKEIKPRTLE